MTLKCPCGREFSQLMPHHIFGNKNLMKYLAVVDQKRETYKLRNYRASSCPGLYWLTGAGSNMLIDLAKQLLINVWSFFKGSSHFVSREAKCS